MPSFSPDLLKDKRFKIKKLQFNTYEVDHPNAKGQLRVINIAGNIFEVPESLIPPEARTGLPNFAIAAQTFIAFTNRGVKGTPSTEALTPDLVKRSKRVDVTSYAQDSPSEPWNEYVVEGEPPLIVKQRTILTKLELIVGHYNQFGDPFLWANTQSTTSVATSEASEAGME
ncbi:MAG: hypothetical protein PXY39_03175 [archaeon]|nr:hypothetical protein [archaeon]